MSEPNQALPDHNLDDYRLLRVIGRGGQAVVYEAEQISLRRRVALKILQITADSDVVSSRVLARETDALVRAKHPGIAEIYGTGLTPDGRPYLAMELIEGMTLAAHIRAHPVEGGLPRIELRERLRMMMQICEAVSCAHQRGVIHCDLKPQNIMVARDPVVSSDALVKVLDFGLARVAARAGQTVSLDKGHLRGTIAYMSPEQSAGTADTADVRTDVYALGVILYELMTGALPYALSEASITQAVLIIQETHPAPLSKFWTEHRLPVDLEIIIGKALEKDPGRRYQSALDLGEDLRRFMDGQPILARAPSTTYQLRKLAGRHKVPLLMGSALLVLFVVFAIYTSVQNARLNRESRRANEEASTAETVSDFLVGMFDVNKPSISMGREVTARELLEDGSRKIESLQVSPPVKARLLYTIGTAFASLGSHERADRAFESALAIQRSSTSPPSLAAAATIEQMAIVARSARKITRADSLLQEALSIRLRLAGSGSVEVAESLHDLGGLRLVQKRFAEAESLLAMAADIRQSKLGPLNIDLAKTLSNLSMANSGLDRDAKAESLLLRSIDIKRATVGEDHIDTAKGYHNLAQRYSDDKRFTEAELYFRKAIAIKERALGDRHPDLGTSLNGLALVYHQTGRHAAAESLYLRNIAIEEHNRGVEDPSLAPALSNLAKLRKLQGRPEEAIALWERCVVLSETGGSSEDTRLSSWLMELDAVYRDTRRFREEEATLVKAIAVQARLFGIDSERVRKTQTMLEAAREAR
ncbi:MAG: serine/threonine protein kinase [bacterium]|nr:serine/threonine protein kinase [bacterium]